MVEFLPFVFSESSQLRANALIKRGSMYMQQQQPVLSTQDFNTAAEIDKRNPDVYHHRGQVTGGCNLFGVFVFLVVVPAFFLFLNLSCPPAEQTDNS